MKELTVINGDPVDVCPHPDRDVVEADGERRCERCGKLLDDDQ